MIDYPWATKSSSDGKERDVLDTPPHRVAQIVDDELYLVPRPECVHALAASQIGADLTMAFGRSRGDDQEDSRWWLLQGPELHLGEDILAPDLGGWRRSRMPVFPRSRSISLPPDWVCEVLSPETVRLDRILKPRAYARAGVRFLWLVDPVAQTLEVYTLSEGNWLQTQTFLDRETVQAAPFEAVPILLGQWWVPEARPEPLDEAASDESTGSFPAMNFEGSQED